MTPNGNDRLGNLFDEAFKLREEKTKLSERISANRESLRNLAGTGILSADEKKQVDELYPPRERKSKKEDKAKAAA